MFDLRERLETVRGDRAVWTVNLELRLRIELFHACPLRIIF